MKPDLKSFFSRKSNIISFFGIAGPLLFMVTQQRLYSYIDLLIIVGLVVSCILLPAYVKWCNSIEDAINLRFAHVTPGRALRIFYPIPIIILSGLALRQINMDMVLYSNKTLLLLPAAAGLQSMLVDLSYRAIGNRNFNTLIAFSAFFWLVFVQVLFVLGLFVEITFSAFFIYFIVKGLVSDFRSHFYPRRGVGIFFGTFNPIHRTHIWIISNAIKDRNLNRVYIHPTTVPKLHREAIKNGEIIVSYENGMRVYHLSEKADGAKNYFPTGNKFYEYEVRSELIRSALDDADLNDKAELLEMPEVYEKFGFSGIVNEIKRMSPGAPIHGLHGSDTGGMWVRNIFDNSGGVYPYPIVRSNNVSATAIRQGAIGYTTNTVESFLESTRKGEGFVFPSGYIFNPENTTDKLQS